METELIIFIIVIIIIITIIATKVKFVYKDYAPKQSTSNWDYSDYGKLIESLGGNEIFYGHGFLNFIINNDRRNMEKVIIIYEMIAKRYIEEDKDIEKIIQNELPHEKYTNKTYQKFITEIHEKGHKRIALKICKQIVVKYLNK